MLRLWAGMAAARLLTGTLASGGIRAAAVNAVMTLVRLAGRIGTWALVASMMLPVSASTTTHAPGGGGGGAVVVGAAGRSGARYAGRSGAPNALVAAATRVSTTTTRQATARTPWRSMAAG